MTLATGSFADVCHDLGYSPARVNASRLDFSNGRDVRQRLDAWYTGMEGKACASQRLDGKLSRSDTLANFTTNALETMIAPVEKPSLERFLFTPGRTGAGGPLLPVRRTIELGKETVSWQVIAHTHEARYIGAGGTRGLKRVGSGEDKESQGAAWHGIRFGWDQFELWRQSHLPNRNIQTESQRAARQGMDELGEFEAGEGSDERKIPGFLNHGASITLGLVKSFGDPTLTSTELWEQLKIMDLAWGRANPNRAPSGVLMPKTHRLNMITIFHGTNFEGVNAWKFAQEAFPFLRNIVEDDRMLTMSQDGGPMWQMWSSDPNLLWRELSPTPMMFGPFNTELETEFILLNQGGGVVNRLAELIMRFNQPTV